MRTAGKTDVELLAHAAHLMIATEAPLSPSGQSRALLERVPSVGRSAVTTLLNRILNSEARRQRLTFRDVDGKNKRCHPKLIGYNQMSHEIREDIENGRLTAVEFVTHHVIAGFEEPNRVAPVSRTLRHKITQSPSGSLLFDLINRMTQWGRNNGYEDMQIYFNNGRTNKNQSAIFSTDIADARDLVYSHFEPIRDFSERLEQHPRQIVQQIQEKMLEVLHREAAWV